MTPITAVTADAYTVPTDHPEADGTLAWNSTTLVLVTATAGTVAGIGYSYTDRCAAQLISDRLAPLLVGKDAMSVPALWRSMVEQVRNLGTTGIAAMAVSAADCALWDLKARLLGLPLCRLLGEVRDSVPVYGSGGFTTYDDALLRHQLQCWTGKGITQVKIKIGRQHERDIARVHRARAMLEPGVRLFVDANGAYSRKEAMALANGFASEGVTWFEEPVPSSDREGLRAIRDHAPAGLEISAGEYGFTLDDFKLLADARAIDVLQADATRCFGLSGFLRVGALCEAYAIPLSSHCAPALHLHAACALPALRHIEYFHDHARIERMLCAGCAEVYDGKLRPDLGAPGMGLEFKTADAQPYRA